jgi:methylenetetrahydrofolate dehydrogenase (NADP+)/methenyltetrahydrofolate cyclohydrolase
MAALLAQTSPGFDATVTILHRAYQGLPDLTLLADILIVAAGQPHVIKKEMVKPGAVVIDVGITKRVSDSHGKSEIVGDVDFQKLLGHASYLTPVPGGVGPMTIAMLIENTWKSYSQSH